MGDLISPASSISTQAMTISPSTSMEPSHRSPVRWDQVASLAARSLKGVYEATHVVLALHTAAGLTVVASEPQARPHNRTLSQQALQMAIALAADNKPALLPAIGDCEELQELRELLDTEAVLHVPLLYEGQYIGSALLGDATATLKESQRSIQQWATSLVSAALVAAIDAADIQARYHQLATENKHPVLAVYENGSVFDCNLAALNAWRLSRDEMLGMSLFDLLSPSADSVTQQMLADALRDGVAETEALCLWPDGKTSPAHLRAQAVAGALHPSLQISVLDLAAIRAEQEQTRKNERLCALGRMAGGTAHHLNGLLGVILGQAQLLSRQQSAPRVVDGARKIEVATLEASAAIKRIAQFAADASGVPQRGLVDLNDIVRQVVESTRPYWADTAQREGRALEIDLELADISLVAGSPDELQQLVTTLIVTACEGMRRGGRIRIRTAESPSCVTLTVKDTEHGTGQRNLPLEFASPFSADGQPAVAARLQTCREIVHRYGGHLVIEDVSGHGTRVLVTLPRANRCDFTVPPTQLQPGQVRARVLVVDDDLPLLETMAEALKLASLEVDTAATGEDALGLLNIRTYDLVITDLSMPGLDGARVAEAAKSLHPDLPVIFLTGWGEQVQPHEARHCDVILSKPVALNELTDVVNRVLAGS